jgi:hypothetical protein
MHHDECDVFSTHGVDRQRRLQVLVRQVLLRPAESDKAGQSTAIHHDWCSLFPTGAAPDPWHSHDPCMADSNGCGLSEPAIQTFVTSLWFP